MDLREDLPEIDPQKVSLQIPSEIVAAGFNVVNRGAPVFGEVIQRTAERLVNVGASLKPLFASSFGFGGANANLKRETGDVVKPALEQENEASSDSLVTAEPPSQFKRSYEPSDGQAAQNELRVSEEEKEKLKNILLARKVIEKLLEKQVEKELEFQKEQITGSEGERKESPQNLAVTLDEQQSPDEQQSVDEQQSQSSSRQESPASDGRQDVESSNGGVQGEIQLEPSSGVREQDQNLQSSPFEAQSSSSAFQASPNVLTNDQISPFSYETNPSAPTGNSPVVRNDPSSFHSAPAPQNPSALPSSPQAFEAAPLQMDPSNPYYHQQSRDYNPHVKRQAPLHDYYQYQPFQNTARYRPQYGNHYVQSHYQPYHY